MGLDNYTTLIYGWLIKGQENVEKFDNDLEEWDEEYHDKIGSVVIEDNMFSEYVYFGAVITRYDPDKEDKNYVIDDLVEISTNKWNKFIEDNPGFKEVIEKYKDSEPKLYLFQNIL